MRLTLLLITLSVALQASATHAGSYATSKRHGLNLELATGNPTTFYCGCSFDARKQILPETCGYTPKRATLRSTRIEWDHIVPASRLGEGRGCWERKEQFPTCSGLSSRKCCEKVDNEYKRATADLINLRPTVGELNAARGNLGFGEVLGEPRQWGQCDFEIANKTVEPPADRKGDIGRIYLYMAREYDVRLTDQEFWKFLGWASGDPITEEELSWRTEALKLRAP